MPIEKMQQIVGMKQIQWILFNVIVLLYLQEPISKRFGHLYEVNLWKSVAMRYLWKHKNRSERQACGNDTRDLEIAKYSRYMSIVYDEMLIIVIAYLVLC